MIFKPSPFLRRFELKRLPLNEIKLMKMTREGRDGKTMRMEEDDYIAGWEPELGVSFYLSLSNLCLNQINRSERADNIVSITWLSLYQP